MSNCAYCGLPACRCSYRLGKLGKSSAQIHNTSMDTTAGDMLQAVVDHFTQLPIDMKGAWSISFTQYDPEKVNRAANRREGQKKHARRLGNKISK